MLETVNTIVVRAPLQRVFELASEIDRWPDILHHYRSVHFLDPTNRSARRAFMAAKHFGIPVSWTSIQRVDRVAHRIRYEHIAGITKGMEVEWSLQHGGAGIEVSIKHWLPEPAGILRFSPARAITGAVFVHGIAERTLRGIKAQAEGAEALVGR